ncbi:YciI family protein [Nocardiopsis sp. RV163]|uniref:YciI family protein n=1 Tax=Nocardiopsis sp. RV163 TaxID=1661388 RepID=UPI00064B9471|nr:YciI family protein [Nocardiopsis sp. RV163]
MRFLMTTRPAEDVRDDEGLYVEMAAFVEELTASGVLLATGGLEPGGVRMVSAGEEITVTDGPFTEAREAVAGFALVEVRSREEALDVARRFRRIVGDGESVIQQVFGP